MSKLMVDEMKRVAVAWGDSKGVARYPGRDDYVAKVEDNLFYGLDSSVRKMFDAGKGGELKDDENSPAKMKALHSSSALVVNFFNYWRGKNDKQPLFNALGLSGARGGEVRFEEKCPTGASSHNPAHLDVFLERVGMSVAVESKFTEWVGTKWLELKDAYFPNGSSLWHEKGWHTLHKLALTLRMDREEPSVFKVLDVPQLMKHLLGLKNKLGDKPFELLYLYYDFAGEKTRGTHLAEIERFAEIVRRDGIAFRALSYQNFWARLKPMLSAEDQAYASYLDTRYFPGQAEEI